MLCVFFKFNRFWSIRNFDLLLIVLLAPGILLVEGGRQWVENEDPVQASSAFDPAAETDAAGTNGPDSSSTGDSPRPDGTDAPQDGGEEPVVPPDNEEIIALPDQAETPPLIEEDPDTGELSAAELPRGERLQRLGYIWLFAVAALFLLRLLLDPVLVRRPLLEPNMTPGGLVFMGCSLMIFLFANIISAKPNADDLSGASDAIKMLQREAVAEDEDAQERLLRRGPGYQLFSLFPIIPSFGDEREIREILDVDPEDENTHMNRYVIAAKSLAIASQILIVLGLVLIGHLHFKSFRAGVGMAVIYLILPYTAVFTGHVMHALPAALMLWALVLLRRPGFAGVFIGLAAGVSYYPLFLLPLWISFYWEKGRARFLIGFFCALAICIGGLMFTSYDVSDFLAQLRTMFGFWVPKLQGLEGVWALGWDAWYRLPLLVAFIALSVSFAFWPEQKNVGTLIAFSGAIMAALQFWHGFEGGLLLAWYVPFALLTIFRPNLDGRIASVELAVAEKARRLRSAEMSEELLPVE